MDGVTIERLFEGAVCTEATHAGAVLRFVFAKGGDRFEFTTSLPHCTLRMPPVAMPLVDALEEKKKL